MEQLVGWATAISTIVGALLLCIDKYIDLVHKRKLQSLELKERNLRLSASKANGNSDDYNNSKAEYKEKAKSIELEREKISLLGDRSTITYILGYLPMIFICSVGMFVYYTENDVMDAKRVILIIAVGTLPVYLGVSIIRKKIQLRIWQGLASLAYGIIILAMDVIILRLILPG
jgi:hypothetical protein